MIEVIFKRLLPASLALVVPSILCGGVISIHRFGARGDGIHDDTQAVQTGINACKPGDTIQFPAGTYVIRKTIGVKSNCSYRGLGNPTLRGHSGQGYGGYSLFQAGDPTGGNLVISGLVFDGGGVYFPDTNGSMTNVTIQGCTFQNIVHSDKNFGPHQSAIFAGGGVLFTNSKIDHNTFTSLGGPEELRTGGDSLKTGIVLYSISNVTISNNTFDLIAGNGISLPYGSKAPHPGLEISGNTFTRIHRIPIEIQMWYLRKPVIRDNRISRPYFPYTFGISFAAGGNAVDDPTNSTGAVIQNNAVDFTQPASGNNRAWAACIEVGGSTTLVDGNTCINGPGIDGRGLWGGAVVIAGLNANIRNNNFCGPWPNGAIEYEPPFPNQIGHPASMTNNSVVASCGVIAAKGTRK